MPVSPGMNSSLLQAKASVGALLAKWLPSPVLHASLHWGGVPTGLHSPSFCHPLQGLREPEEPWTHSLLHHPCRACFVLQAGFCSLAQGLSLLWLVGTSLPSCPYMDPASGVLCGTLGAFPGIYLAVLLPYPAQQTLCPALVSDWVLILCVTGEGVEWGVPCRLCSRACGCLVRSLKPHALTPKHDSRFTPKAFFFYVKRLLLVFTTHLHWLLENGEAFNYKLE